MSHFGGFVPSKQNRFKEYENAQENGEAEGEDGVDQRKKTKKEVMEEIIAKSKYHKVCIHSKWYCVIKYSWTGRKTEIKR
jgi:hypothetical protein